MKLCSVPGCNRTHESKGLCKSHAQRSREGRPLYCLCGKPIPLLRGAHLTTCLTCKEKISCSVSSCKEKAFQRGYCQLHYMRWYRMGLVEQRCIKCSEPTGSETAQKKYCDSCRILRNRELGAEKESRRRAAFSLPYNRSQIYDLDGGTCYLCQGVVEYEQCHLDHIFPIALGGHDATYNVAMTHKICNNRKSAMSLENLFVKFPEARLPERFLTWKQSKDQ